MEYLNLFMNSLLDLSYAMAPYILFGLAFAGVLHELVPQDIVTKHLGSENIASVIKSTIFGIPLPVCSCGVIPLASSIKKSGASKGATLSFLISTPITGADSILATYGMFGWVFTLYHIFTSMMIAIVAGVLANYLDKEEVVLEKEEPKSCCSSGSSCETQNRKNSFSFIAAMKYAFVTLLGDISKPLLLGLVLGAVITTLIPQDLSELLQNSSWLSYLIAIAIAVPMYVCATASLPIAAALMLGGVSPGAAFVFLTAGPATNTVTIGVVKKMLGSVSLYIYLGTIVVGSVVFGLGLDYIFSVNAIDVKSVIHFHEEVGLVEILSAIALWGLMMYFLVEAYFKREKNEK